MGSKNEGYFWRVDGCSTSTPARRAVISAQYSLSRIEHNIALYARFLGLGKALLGILRILGFDS